MTITFSAKYSLSTITRKKTTNYSINIMTFHAKFCLQRARFVVDPRVDDSAVVAALVASQAIFFLQDGHAEFRVAEGDLAGGCRTHYTATNYNHIVLRSTKVWQKEGIEIDIIHLKIIRVMMEYTLVVGFSFIRYRFVPLSVHNIHIFITISICLNSFS